MKNFKSFKESAKWYSNADDMEREKKKGSYFESDYDPDTDTYTSPNFDPGDDDDSDSNEYHFDDDDYDDDYDDGDYDDGDYGDYGPYGYGKEEDIRYKLDPKAEYNVGDEIVYVGNTKGKNRQEGVIRRIRDDKKYVVRFEDKKLIAISKQYLRHKMDDDEYNKKLEEIEKIKAAKEAEKEAKRKAREEEEKNNPKKTDYVPGLKWWEKK